MESDIRVRLGRAPTVTVAVTVTVTVTRLAGTVPLRGNRRAGPEAIKLRLDLKKIRRSRTPLGSDHPGSPTQDHKPSEHAPPAAPLTTPPQVDSPQPLSQAAGAQTGAPDRLARILTAPPGAYSSSPASVRPSRRPRELVSPAQPPAQGDGGLQHAPVLKAREIRPNYFISNFIQNFCQLYLILSYFYQVFYQHCPSNIIKYHGFIHMNILNISLIYPSYINTFPDISSTFLFYPDISNTVL